MQEAIGYLFQETSLYTGEGLESISNF